MLYEIRALCFIQCLFTLRLTRLGLEVSPGTAMVVSPSKSSEPITSLSNTFKRSVLGLPAKQLFMYYNCLLLQYFNILHTQSQMEKSISIYPWLQMQSPTQIPTPVPKTL